jgi:hypothetical protein
MAKRKSRAVVMVADEAGGMVKVEDRRFKAADWPVCFDVPKGQADRWFHYFDAECGSRGWSSSEMGQLERHENSGSITITAGANGPQLAVVWERKHLGALRVRAGPAEPPEFTASELAALFERINEQCRAGITRRSYRRGHLYYNGLRWSGELWLEDTVRLGPPTIQHEPDLSAPRVVLVDLLVDSVGPKDANYTFGQKLEELSAFLSVVLDCHVHPPQNRRTWTYILTPEGKPLCDVRWLGYIEPDVPAQMPDRDTHKPMPMHAVTRPDFSFSVNSFVGAQELSLPVDIVDLWQAYRSLSLDKHRQFLQVAAKLQEAFAQAADRPSLSFALMVVACEALKPSDRQFRRHNMNHVVEALLGKTIAKRLKNDDFRAQYNRSIHLHLGEFLGSEFQAGSMVSRFHDPTFGQAHRELADVVQAAIIEWLRLRGAISMAALKKARSVT